MSKRNEPPKHYDNELQPWDVIKDWGLCFWLGNVIKYLCRAGKKDGETELKDLIKARHYLDERIRQVEANQSHKPGS